MLKMLLSFSSFLPSSTGRGRNPPPPPCMPRMMPGAAVPYPPLARTLAPCAPCTLAALGTVWLPSLLLSTAYPPLGMPRGRGEPHPPTLLPPAPQGPTMSSDPTLTEGSCPSPLPPAPALPHSACGGGGGLGPASVAASLLLAHEIADNVSTGVPETLPRVLRVGGSLDTSTSGARDCTLSTRA